MAKSRLPIYPHLSHDEIDRRYRACRGGVEKTHWHALWLLSQPDHPPSPAQVAKLVGLSPGWVRMLIQRWNTEGPAGLADRRAITNGGRAKLTTEQQIELWAALQPPPPDGGLWTGPKVARYVEPRWGITVTPRTGWRWLRGLGFSLQVPRPRHPEAATPAQQRAWKRQPGPSTRRVASAASGQDHRTLGRG